MKNDRFSSAVFTMSCHIKPSYEFETYMLLLISGGLSIHFNSSRLQVDNYLLLHIHIFVFKAF